MPGASLEFDLNGLTAKFERLRGRLADLTPLMERIGGALLLSSQMRFETKTAPDGEKWAALAASTIAQRLKKNYSAADILRRTGDMYRSLNYRPGPARVVVSMGGVGNSTAYAAYHQFGTRKMPARPVLGISAEDERDIVGIVDDFLRESIDE